MDEEKNFPTMIIPNGTRIEVNDQGQLSIRTPGNLVIQNSGNYSVVESERGSIRVDPGVKVEAVSVLASDACYIAGTLTAWRVKARKIILEKGAQAYIMLQESEGLELDRSARLVGNFASEKELYLLLGRFTRQIQKLPAELGPAREAPRLGGGVEVSEAAQPFGEEEVFVSPDGEGEPGEAVRQREEDALGLVQVVLERELGRQELDDDSRSAVERLLELVRNGDQDRLQESYEYLLSQVRNPGQELQEARKVLARILHQ